MNLTFSPRAWYEYTGWQLEDKKILKRINLLIKDIERNGNTGIGKPEPLRDWDGYWSRRINDILSNWHNILAEERAVLLLLVNAA